MRKNKKNQLAQIRNRVTVKKSKNQYTQRVNSRSTRQHNRQSARQTKQSTLQQKFNTSSGFRYSPKERSKLQSQKLSTRNKKRKTSTAHLTSVQKAFKTMGIDDKITKRNYKHFFQLLDDAKITAGEQNYATVLASLANKVNLASFDGRIFDAFVDEEFNVPHINKLTF